MFWLYFSLFNLFYLNICVYMYMHVCVCMCVCVFCLHAFCAYMVCLVSGGFKKGIGSLELELWVTAVLGGEPRQPGL